MSVTYSHAEPSIAGVGDYIELMKPRVMSLVVFTAFVGLAIAPGHLHPVIALTALICIAVGAGAAGALNMWYEIDGQPLTGEDRPRHLDADAQGEFPVPEQGEHDLEPPSNQGVWPVPITIR